MNIIYPISFLTNSFKGILSCFLDEITVLFPFSDYSEIESESIKINIFNDFREIDNVSPKDISNIIKWAGQFENFSNSILSDSLRHINDPETISEIANSIKGCSSKDVCAISKEGRALLWRFFYEYDRKQEEINFDYDLFLKKFANLPKILNGNEDSGEFSATENLLKINPIDFDLLKPGLRLKLWAWLLNEVSNDIPKNFIGISKEIREIASDVYFSLTRELPETLIELDCEGLKIPVDDKKDIALLIDKIFEINNKDMPDKNTVLSQILGKLEAKWKSTYKPRENSIVKLSFIKLKEISLNEIFLYYAGLKGKKDVFFRKNETLAIFIG